MDKQAKLSSAPAPSGICPAWTEDLKEELNGWYLKVYEPDGKTMNNEGDAIRANYAKFLLGNFFQEKPSLRPPAAHLICPTCEKRVCEDIDHHKAAKPARNEEFLKWLDFTAEQTEKQSDMHLFGMPLTPTAIYMKKLKDCVLQVNRSIKVKYEQTHSEPARKED